MIDHVDAAVRFYTNNVFGLEKTTSSSNCSRTASMSRLFQASAPAANVFNVFRSDHHGFSFSSNERVPRVGPRYARITVAVDGQADVNSTD